MRATTKFIKMSNNAIKGNVRNKHNLENELHNWEQSFVDGIPTTSMPKSKDSEFRYSFIVDREAYNKALNDIEIGLQKFIGRTNYDLMNYMGYESTDNDVIMFLKRFENDVLDKMDIVPDNSVYADIRNYYTSASSLFRENGDVLKFKEFMLSHRDVCPEALWQLAQTNNFNLFDYLTSKNIIIPIVEDKGIVIDDRDIDKYGFCNLDDMDEILTRSINRIISSEIITLNPSYVEDFEESLDRLTTYTGLAAGSFLREDFTNKDNKYFDYLYLLNIVDNANSIQKLGNDISFELDGIIDMKASVLFAHFLKSDDALGLRKDDKTLKSVNEQFELFKDYVNKLNVRAQVIDDKGKVIDKKISFPEEFEDKFRQNIEDFNAYVSSSGKSGLGYNNFKNLANTYTDKIITSYPRRLEITDAKTTLRSFYKTSNSNFLNLNFIEGNLPSIGDTLKLEKRDLRQLIVDKSQFFDITDDEGDIVLSGLSEFDEIFKDDKLYSFDDYKNFILNFIDDASDYREFSPQATVMYESFFANKCEELGKLEEFKQGVGHLLNNEYAAFGVNTTDTVTKKINEDIESSRRKYQKAIDEFDTSLSIKNILKDSYESLSENGIVFTTKDATRDFSLAEYNLFVTKIDIARSLTMEDLRKNLKIAFGDKTDEFGYTTNLFERFVNDSYLALKELDNKGIHITDRLDDRDFTGLNEDEINSLICNFTDLGLLEDKEKLNKFIDVLEKHGLVNEDREEFVNFLEYCEEIAIKKFDEFMKNTIPEANINMQVIERIKDNLEITEDVKDTIQYHMENGDYPFTVKFFDETWEIDSYESAQQRYNLSKNMTNTYESILNSDENLFENSPFDFDINRVHNDVFLYNLKEPIYGKFSLDLLGKENDNILSLTLGADRQIEVANKLLSKVGAISGYDYHLSNIMKNDNIDDSKRKEIIGDIFEYSNAWKKYKDRVRDLDLTLEYTIDPTVRPYVYPEDVFIIPKAKELFIEAYNETVDDKNKISNDIAYEDFKNIYIDSVKNIVDRQTNEINENSVYKKFLNKAKGYKNCRYLDLNSYYAKDKDVQNAIFNSLATATGEELKNFAKVKAVYSELVENMANDDTKYKIFYEELEKTGCLKKIEDGLKKPYIHIFEKYNNDILNVPVEELAETISKLKFIKESEVQSWAAEVDKCVVTNNKMEKELEDLRKSLNEKINSTNPLLGDKFDINNFMENNSPLIERLQQKYILNTKFDEFKNIFENELIGKEISFDEFKLKVDDLQKINNYEKFMKLKLEVPDKANENNPVEITVEDFLIKRFKRYGEVRKEDYNRVLNEISSQIDLNIEDSLRVDALDVLYSKDIYTNISKELDTLKHNQLSFEEVLKAYNESKSISKKNNGDEFGRHFNRLSDEVLSIKTIEEGTNEAGVYSSDVERVSVNQNAYFQQTDINGRDVRLQYFLTDQDKRGFQVQNIIDALSNDTTFNEFFTYVDDPENSSRTIKRPIGMRIYKEYDSDGELIHMGLAMQRQNDTKYIFANEKVLESYIGSTFVENGKEYPFINRELLGLPENNVLVNKTAKALNTSDSKLSEKWVEFLLKKYSSKELIERQAAFEESYQRELRAGKEEFEALKDAAHFSNTDNTQEGYDRAVKEYVETERRLVYKTRQEFIDEQIADLNQFSDDIEELYFGGMGDVGGYTVDFEADFKKGKGFPVPISQDIIDKKISMEKMISSLDNDSKDLGQDEEVIENEVQNDNGLDNGQ